MKIYNKNIKTGQKNVQLKYSKSQHYWRSGKVIICVRVLKLKDECYFKYGDRGIIAITEGIIEEW